MANQESPIPRGIEVLVKKAAVDPEFKQTLLEKRAAAAGEIELKLEPAEVAMISAVPREQLETIIANTNVNEVTRAAFLGRAAAVMLAALGVSATGCSRTEMTDGIRPDRTRTLGERPDQPPKKDVPKEDPPPAAETTLGIGPDMPPPPERPAEVRLTDGIRPDRPAAKEGERPAEPPVAQGIRPE